MSYNNFMLLFTIGFFFIARGSAELLEESGPNVSPSESLASIPTCMPFSWFGDKDKDKDREPSSSTSSLPQTTVEPSEQQDRKNKVQSHFFVIIH